MLLPRFKYPSISFMGSDSNEYIEPRCKVAIVIEGGTTLGHAVADALLGHHAEVVVITSADCQSGQKATERLNADHGLDKAHFIQADPSCLANLQEVFKETFATFGRADIVVNNPRTLTENDSWEQDLNMNLTNIYRGSVLALKHMSRSGEKSRGGIIINNGTTAALEPVASSPALAAANHGVVGATRSLGDLATYNKTGVRVVGLLSEMFMSNEDPLTRKSNPDSQHPEALAVGKASVHLVKRASPGSIWIVKGGQLHIAEFPSPFSYAKLVQRYV